jgi:hypothetical protein
MRRNSLVVVLLGILSGTTMARADVPAWTLTGFNTDQSGNKGHFSLGFTFGVEVPMTITSVGALDIGGNTIPSNQPMLVKIYESGPSPDAGIQEPNGEFSGTLLLTSNVSSTDPILSLSGGTYTSGDGFRYHHLAAPLNLTGGTYMIQESNFGTGFKAVGQNLALAPFMEGPYHPTYTIADDTATYGTSVADFDQPGLFGPNFLLAVPEPAAIGVLALFGLLCIRRRRVPLC